MANKAADTTTASGALGVSDKADETTFERGNALRKFGKAVAASGRKSVTGIAEVDRAALNIMRASLDNTVDHAREVIKAHKFSDVVGLHVNFLANQLERSATQMKDLVDLAEARTKDAWEPLMELAETSAKPLGEKQDTITK